MARGLFGRRRRRRRRRQSPRKKRQVQAAMFAGGIAALVLSSAATLILVLGHFGGMSVPGCGIDSPCAEAASSVWGKVPLIHWPVSFVGLAYFLGALFAWVLVRGAVPAALRHLIRLGAAISLGFIVVIVIGAYGCAYCIAAHVGNLAFSLIAERHRPPAGPARRPAVAVAAVFAAASVVLGLVQWRTHHVVQADQQAQLDASTDRVIAQAAGQAQAADDASSRESPPPGDSENLTGDLTGGETLPRGFTGRYRRGPKQAAIRLVVFTDFECPACRRFEAELRALLGIHDDVSLSVKHFPACEECNDRFRKKNQHPNACRAARVAEAAGILWGNDGFWEMHDWLFDHAGKFAFGELFDKVGAHDRDTTAFIRLLEGDETLERVQADIEEAVSLGIKTTPMVFANGVELQGLGAANAIRQVITRLADERPMTAENDRPPPAAERFLALWRGNRQNDLPADAHAWPDGPDDARIQVVLWGDYQDRITAEVDTAIRKILAERTDARYAFRHFPINQTCNSTVPRSENLQGCFASQAAEAAGILGGIDGYWKMHGWLMRNQVGLSDTSVRRAAKELDLDAEALFKTMEQPDTTAAIEEDVQAGSRAGLQRIPWLYVNGKHVPRFHGEGESILRLIFENVDGP